MSWFAVCDRRGVIDIVHTVPAGRLVIIDDPDEKLLRSVVEPAARLAYDGVTMLVPGVPEARSDGAALQAVIAFQRWMRQRMAVAS